MTRANHFIEIRATLVVALVLSLAINPVAGFVHSWSHLDDHAGEPEKSLHHDTGACELCAVYAAIGHSIPVSDFSLPRPAGHVPVESESPEGVLPSTRVPYRQRPPPRLLQAV